MPNYYPPANWEAPREDGYCIYPDTRGGSDRVKVEGPNRETFWCWPEQIDQAIECHKTGLCWECLERPGTRAHYSRHYAALLICDECWADHEAQRDYEDTRRQPADLQ